MAHTYTDQLAASNKAETLNIASTRGWRSAPTSHFQRCMKNSTHTRNASAHTVRCITTSNAFTLDSCLKKAGSRPQAT